MRLNPQLSSHITLVPNPVWDDPGTWMSIEGKGPATRYMLKIQKRKGLIHLIPGRLFLRQLIKLLLI